MSHLHRTSLLTGLLLLASGPAVSGCSCEDDRPYTPFSVAQGTSSGGATQAPPLAVVGAGVVMAPQPRLTELPIFDHVLAAPAGSTFLLAARLPGTTQSEERWLSWTLGPPQAGGLWLHDAQGRPERHLLRSPAFLPQSPDCQETVSLQPGTGSTLSLDVRRKCTSRQLPGSAERALLLVDLARSEPLAFGLRLSATPEGETLDLHIEAVDLDSDGSSDANVTFALSGPAGGEEKLAVHWLSRPAGPSRQKDTPRVEFMARAQALVVSAQRKAERAQVPQQVESLRRLYATLCAEGQSPRVQHWDGSPIICGGMDEGLEKLTLARVHAELGLGRPGLALGELARFDWFGSARPGEKTRQAIEQAILKRVPSGPARRLGDFSVPELPPRSGVPLGRLRFDAQSTLWSLGKDGATHQVWPPAALPAALPAAGPDALPEALPPPPPTFPTWELGPKSPSGQRLVGVLPSCERPELLLALSDEAGTPLAPQALEVLAPRPGQCKAAFGGAPLQAQLLDFQGGSATLLVAGQVLRGDRKAPTDASAPGPLGFFDARPQGAILWRTSSLGAAEDCVLTGSREHLACLEKGRVVVYQQPETTTAAP